MKASITEISSKFVVGEVILYLIGGERTAIIDTGTNVSPDNDIAPVLERLGLSLGDIDYILNTHGHFDHTGGNAAIKRRSSRAQILIHADEAAQVENRQYYFEQFFAPTTAAILGQSHVDEEWAKYTAITGPEVAVDRTIKDGDIIDLGGGCQLQVIHLPGHTVGSLGFYWPEEGILFTGDSLPGLHEGSGALPIIVDLEAYTESVRRLMGLPVRLIMQSHDHRGVKTPPSHIRRGSEVQQYLKDCLDVAERIYEAVESVAPRAAGEPVLKIYDEVVARMPAEMRFKPATQLAMPLLSAWVVYFTLKRIGAI